MKRRRQTLFLAGAIITGLIITVVLVVTSGNTPARADWYGLTWQYRKELVIDHTKVANTDQTNFPILVKRTDADLKTVANGGHVQKTNGGDIAFTASNGKTKLDYELESYDATTGSIVAWVRIPTLSATTDTTIYMYYGNANATNQWNPAGVWSNAYVGVWHLAETSGNHLTSTNTASINSSSITVTAQGSATGITNGADDFNGSSDFIDILDNAALRQDGDMTIETWIKADAQGGRPMSKGLNAAPWSSYEIWLKGAADSNRVQFSWANDSGTGFSRASNTAITLGTWYHVVGVKSGSSIILYLNGVDDHSGASPTVSGSIASSSPIRMTFGNSSAHNSAFDGVQDEVRYSNVARSADWIATTYNTINGFATFFTSTSSEQTSISPVAAWSFDEGYGTTTSDASGQGLTANISGASWQTDSMCVSGKCLYLDGSNDYVYAADNTSFKPTSDMTISTWVKLNQLATTKGETEMLLRKDSSGSPYHSYQFSVSSTNNKLDFQWCNTAGTCYDANSNTALTTNVWYLVSAIKSGSNLYVYINGSNDTASGSSSTTGTIFNSNGYFTIGAVDSTQKRTNGFFDEVKMYPYARTAAQLRSDYNAGKSHASSSKGVGVALGNTFGNADSLSNGLVGYWRMDETSWNGTAGEVVDSSGNGNNGQSKCVGSCSVPSTTVGKFANSGSFDGTDDYVSVNNSTSLKYSDQLTVSAWVNNRETRNARIAISKGADRSRGWYWWIRDPSTGQWQIQNNTAGQHYSYTSGIIIPNNEWHLLTTVMDQTNRTINFYYDGNLVNTSTGAVPFADNTSDSYILGDYNGAGGYLWNGNLDDIRIYNRALSPSEVAALYNWAPGPVININFDNYSGTTFYDQSGNNHNATSQDITTNAACNTNNMFSSHTLNTWLKLHDSIATNSETVQNSGRTVTYTRGVDYDMDYPNGSIMFKSSGTMQIDTWYYINSTCTNTGPKLVDGKFGKALLFDGADDGLIINSAADIANNANSRTTFEAWVYVNANVNDQYYNVQGIVGQNYGDPNIHYSNGKFVESLNFVDQSREYLTSSTYPTKNWYHVAGTWDGQYAKIYINGVFAGTSADWSGYTVRTRQDNYYIGRSQSGASKGIFNGIIDEVKVYNYVRTPKQITEDMNAGHAAPGSPVGSALGHWEFEEGFGDTLHNTGNGDSTLNGNLAGSGTTCPAAASSCPTWSSSGKIGKTLSFDNSNDFVDLGTNSSLRLTSGGTISAWIYPNSAGGATRGRIVDKSLDTGNSGGYGMMMYDNNTVMVQMRSNWIQTLGTNPIPFGAWSHIVWTFDGNYWKIFVNGKLNNNTANSRLPEDIAASTYIGNRASATDRAFDGLIDELKIYNFPLTEDQVKTEYNSGVTTVMGGGSTAADGITTNNSADREFCVPGDTSTCSAPVGWWKFDEGSGTTANDVSGNAYSGDLGCRGTCTDLPTWANGVHGKALNFDGTGSFVEVASNTAVAISGPITIEAWINPSTTTLPTVRREIFSKNGDANYYRMEINDGGTLKFATYGLSSTSIDSLTAVTANKWSHITMVYNGSRKYIYINGSLDYSEAATGTMNTTDADYSYIGGYPGGSGAYFPGKIDDIRIYNYARTPAQIAWDYNQGAPIAQYDFDECTGTVAHDTAPKADRSTAGTSGSINVGTNGQTAAGSCTTSASTMWYNGVSGKYGASLNFDGNDDNINVGGDSKFDFDGTKPFSIAAWIKLSGGGTRFIVSKYNVDVGGQYYLMITNSKLSMLREVSPYSITGNTTLSNSVWYHVAGIYDGTNMSLYINGKSDATPVGIGSVGSSSVNLAIGAELSSGNPINTFNGQLDDVRIYNYALTSKQIQDLYNNNSAIQFSQ